ncbi:voltage-gated delayed rectifier potassium channel KCNH4-like [Lonchura striata]
MMEVVWEGLCRYSRSPRLPQAPQPRPESGAAPEKPLPSIVEDEEEPDEVFQQSPASTSRRKPLLPALSSSVRRGSLSSLLGDELRQGSALRHGCPSPARGGRSPAPQCPRDGRLPERDGGAGGRPPKLLIPSLLSSGPPDLSPRYAGMCGRLIPLPRVCATRLCPGCPTDILGDAEMVARRVVDGIEDNGGASEPQTFCFSTEPPQSAPRDSPSSGTDAGGPALLMEAERIKQNISRLNQEISHLNREVSHLSRELQNMMELLRGHLGAPQPPACPCRLPATVSPPSAAPVPPSPPVPPSSLSSPTGSPRAKRCPVRSRSAHAAALHPWLGAEGPRPPRGDTPDPRRGSDSEPPPLPPRSARSFPGCSAGAGGRARPQPRSGSTSSR